MIFASFFSIFKEKKAPDVALKRIAIYHPPNWKITHPHTLWVHGGSNMPRFAHVAAGPQKNKKPRPKITNADIF